MNAKKQISLEQLFLLYPQLRIASHGGAGEDQRLEVSAARESGHGMSASAEQAEHRRGA